MELHFKNISGKDNIGDFTWIHQSGRQAIIADMVSGTDTELGISLLKEWLLENQNDAVFSSGILISELNVLFRDKGVQAALGVLTKGEKGYSCLLIGNLRLYKVGDGITPVEDWPIESQPTSLLGQGELAELNPFEIPCNDGILYVLASDGVRHEQLLESELSYESLQSGNLYKQFVPCVADKDWSALVFPIAQAHSFTQQDWPYNPFVGQQEERAHEKRGLSEIASELFKHPQFDGFRIVSCPPILKSNSSRLFDGLLVYPYGVIPLELKDHHGQVTVDMATNRRNSMTVINERGEATFANPVHKLRESLRQFGDLSVLKALDPICKNSGLVIFTSPNAEVSCSYNDELTPAPFFGAGEVMVAKTQQLTDLLLKFCKGRFGKKLKPKLDESEMNRLVDELTKEKSDHDGEVLIGDYRCEPQPLENESTDYYKIYPAREFDDLLWAKCFTFDHLSAVHRQAEIQSLGRESQILNRLGRKRISGVQYFYGREITDDHLYIFLEPAPETNLIEWLEHSQDRNVKLDILIEIAKILKGVQSVGEPHIIHRAINPYNVRVDDSGQPVLINFELCQLETVATLPINARRTFTQKYQAPEVNEPGQTLTFAVDIYSLGLLAFQVLTGELPFKESPRELATKGKRRTFWPELCKQMGVTASNAEFLQRIFHSAPKHRPEIEKVIEVFTTWKN